MCHRSISKEFRFLTRRHEKLAEMMVSIKNPIRSQGVVDDRPSPKRIFVDVVAMASDHFTLVVRTFL